MSNSVIMSVIYYIYVHFQVNVQGGGESKCLFSKVFQMKVFVAEQLIQLCWENILRKM